MLKDKLKQSPILNEKAENFIMLHTENERKKKRNNPACLLGVSLNTVSGSTKQDLQNNVLKRFDCSDTF